MFQDKDSNRFAMDLPRVPGMNPPAETRKGSAEAHGSTEAHGSDSAAGIQCIAFLVSDLEQGLHRRMLSVLKEECAARQIRLLVYEGRALETPVFHARCYNTVYRIVSEHRVDAMIVASSELGMHVGPEGLSRFLERFSIPVVFIGTPLKGVSCFSSDDTASVKLLLDHMAKHQKRHIVWVSGPVSDPHALVRLFAFRDHITRINPSFDERQDILQGTDSTRGGFEIMAKLHGRIGKSVEAVCFANDEMAIGAIDYCGLHGIRVPEDIAITGMDDIEMSAQVTPGLTTISHNYRSLCVAALEQLAILHAARTDTPLEIEQERLDTDQKERLVHAGDLEVNTPEPIRSVFSPKLKIRGSCGCDAPERPIRNPFLDAVVQHGPFIGETIQTFNTEELFDQLEGFLRERNIAFSFLMAYEDLPEAVSCHNFEAPMFSRMLHGYIDGHRVYETDPFQTSQLLPDTFWDRLSDNPLLIQPLFFQNEVFGYLVAPAETAQRTGVNDLRLMVSLTIKGERLIMEREHAQKRIEWALDAMRSVNTKLSDISMRDELTGLFNRRGFIQESTRYLYGGPTSFLLVFVDMNGLKVINDEYGHDDGDLALKTTGDVLKHCFRDRDILARIGGDEFAALVKDVGEEQIERLEARFEGQCRVASDALGKPYHISFARGYVKGDAASDLEEMMNEADQRMYANKKAQKENGG